MKQKTKDIMLAWTEALRSGDFEQGGAALEDGGKFCCLGVGCRVAGDPTRGLRSTWGLPPYLGRFSMALDDAGRLMDSDLIESGESGHMTNAVSLNDDLGYSFEEIASIIDQNVAAKLGLDAELDLAKVEPENAS